MSIDRWSFDRPTSPDEEALIAADDALLDALGSRTLRRSDVEADPAARLLAAWVADLDDLAANDPRVAGTPLAAPSRSVVPPIAPVPDRTPSRPVGALGAALVAAALLAPAGVAAATGYSPAAPYRQLISTVLGTDEPSAAERARQGIEAARAALERGDATEAAAVLAALASDPALSNDPEIAGLIAELETDVADALEQDGSAAEGSGADVPVSNGNAGGNDKSQGTTKAPASSNAGGNDKSQGTTKAPASSNAGGNDKSQGTTKAPASSNAGGNDKSQGTTKAPASSNAGGNDKSQGTTKAPASSNAGGNDKSVGTSTVPGSSGTAGSSGTDVPTTPSAASPPGASGSAGKDNAPGSSHAGGNGKSKGKGPGTP